MGDEEKTVRTDFLFARPSFWSGAGRLLDLWGKFDEYNTSASPEEADARALYSDWRITGQDVLDTWFSFHEADAVLSNKKSDYKCTLCGKIALPRTAASQKKIQKKEHGREQRR